jgi:hypothetical protein
MAFPVAILTEGSADDIFIGKLIEENGLEQGKFYIPPFPQNEIGGLFNFWRKIQSIRSTSAPYILRKSKAMVIIADNDNNPKDRFDEVKNQIQIANQKAKPEDLFGIPKEPREAAQKSITLPPVYILMLPWDNVNGCLETLCIQSANKAKYKTQLDCAEQFAGCVGAEKWVEPSNGLPDIARESKFRVKSILASICNDPYTPFNSAWNPKKSPMDIFLLKDAVFSQIINFLTELTRDEEATKAAVTL